LRGSGHFKSLGRHFEGLGEGPRIVDETMDGPVPVQFLRRASNADKIAQVCDDDVNLGVSRRQRDLLTDSRAELGVSNEKNHARAEVGQLRGALQTET
jgi:hypothetical protein